MDTGGTAEATAQGGNGHPELGGERLHLAAAVEALQRAVDAPLKIAMGDMAATLFLENYRAWRRQELREAVKSPYFARIDFVPDDRGRVETYYLGKTFFADGHVHITGWQAPVAALFYRALEARASYVAPMGEISGEVQLKRRFVVEHSRLRHMADDLDERPLSEGRARAIQEGHSRDDLLRQVLSERATPWLRDIIVTLQGDQYALITAPTDRVLLIQGVAGSGKTSIALHRLSYLVYPSLIAAKVPPRCIVFGPNRLFLKYVSAVLPRLGLQHVVQTTIGEWGLERLGLKKARLVDPTFETLLSPKAEPAEKERAARRSRLKTSARMAALLERYVERRRAEIGIPDEGWLFELTVQKFPGSLERATLRRRMEAEALRASHAKHASRPYPLHRAFFAEDALTTVTSLFDAAQTPAEVEQQLALGRKRLEQAVALRKEAQRIHAQIAAAAGAPPPPRERNEKVLNPTFSLPTGYGKPAVVRTGPPPSALPPRPGTLPAANVALLRQNARNIELAAERRQQEGEELIARAQAASALALPVEIREEAHKGARAEVKRLVDHYWPPVDPVADYHALLQDGALLRELGEGIFEPDELTLLEGSAKREARAVDAADLPAMHYLCILTQPPEDLGAVNHDYVVVDEAQDLSELDLLCLRKLERKPSVTFLGDLSQSIYAHRGATSWSHLTAAYGDRDVTYEECPVSYRTTYEITSLANRVLRSLARVEGRAGAAERLAQAFDRHGPPPVLERVETAAELPGAVRRAVDELLAEGQRSVAVICKTPQRAREIYDSLEAGGVAGASGAAAPHPSGPADSAAPRRRAALVTQPDYEYEGGVVVVPVALAKGLEFDAAVIVDADARSYSGSAFDGRLLYVALTRAMHALRVVWTGDGAQVGAGLTPHLLGDPDLP